MGRGPVHPVETKLKIVLSVLSSECSQAEAARRHGISETSIGKWREQFLAGGKAGLVVGSAAARPTGREPQRAAEKLRRVLPRAGRQKILDFLQDRSPGFEVSVNPSLAHCL